MRKNKIVQLSDIEHVRQKSGMYLGDMSQTQSLKYIIDDNAATKKNLKYCPAVLKLFDEIISNSIDEALRTNYKHANKITVTVDGNTIQVTDNGRGIPVKEDPGTGQLQSLMAFTHLRAGSNFSDESFVSIGTHGLGATLVNIMSATFRAETDDGKKRMSLVCSNSMETINHKTGRSRGKTKTGTSVMFVPDFSRFGINKLGSEVDLIEKRIADLAVCFPDITFRYNGKIVRLKSFKNYVNLYSDKADLLIDENYSLAVFPVEEPTQISFVNGIDTYEGGTHVSYVMSHIVSKIGERLNKKYKKLKITPADIKNHLGLILVTNKIENPKFRSQTKEYITNSQAEIKPVFKSIEDADAFVRKILRNDDIVDAIIETKKLKTEAQERVALKKAKRTAKKIKVASHIPANSKYPNKKTLYITEGQSAIGQLCNVRDPALHGGYPLKGKILNVSGVSPSVIIKNKELSELMAIIGLHLGERPNDLNYGNIAILTDADSDGHHIACLLLNFFSLWPDLFKEKRVSMIRSPILISKKGRKTERFYDLEDFDQKKYSDWKTTYFKGLGGLPVEEYEKMIHEPVKDLVEMDDDTDQMLKIAFGNDAQLRKDWLAQ